MCIWESLGEQVELNNKEFFGRFYEWYLKAIIYIIDMHMKVCLFRLKRVLLKDIFL